MNLITHFRHIIAATVILAICALMLTGMDEKNTMHPAFDLLDKEGNKTTTDSLCVSPSHTCGQCHDTRYINEHNLHYGKNVKATCVQCHLKGGKISGDLSQTHLQIQQPADENCALCHGLIHQGDSPLTIPGDYTSHFQFEEGQHFYGLSQHTGVVMSPHNLSQSVLNLENKKELQFPWDIHFRRRLNCISCHFTRNNLRYCSQIKTPLGHLIRDPRKTEPPHQYLKRPNHELETASCSCCHAPYAVHSSLPYKKRHMDVLSCEACHIPRLYGPALQSVDHTVVTLTGESRVEFRGVNEELSHGSSFNTMYYSGYTPFLLPQEDKTGIPKISPFNLVTHWQWVSGKSATPVPMEVLKGIYLEESGYRPGILDIFDKDNDKKIDKKELVLDTREKIALISSLLLASGIESPRIEAYTEPRKVNHGIGDTLHMTRDCSSCHSSSSRFSRDILLAAHPPVGLTPELDRGGVLTPPIGGTVMTDKTGQVIFKRSPSLQGRYIFGYGRLQFIDKTGFWIFMLSLLFILVHGGARWISSRKHEGHDLKREKVYMYTFYERLWHWTMALGVILLALTGLEIHYAGHLTLFGLALAVTIHNVIALILTVNAALSLFYHLVTGEIMQFFTFNRRFIQETLIQIYYYISGIFKKAPHPIARTRTRKLNPLQQLTYIILLNLLLPFQILTGILIWGADRWTYWSESFGGLTILGPVHNLGSWFLLSFLVVHIYLTTTGHTPLANIRAMVTGYDEIEKGREEPDAEMAKLLDMKVTDLAGTLIHKFSARRSPIKEETNE